MVGRSLLLLSALALVLGAAPASGAPKAKPKAAASAKGKKSKEKKEKSKEQDKEAEKENEEPEETESAAEAARASTKEEGVKSAGTTAPKQTDAGDVQVKSDKEGVKTYKFETIEVEGRLKSPQVIYFLRRVRAEFEAGALGHRSFLGELSDSRRSAAFR